MLATGCPAVVAEHATSVSTVMASAPEARMKRDSDRSILPPVVVESLRGRTTDSREQTEVPVRLVEGDDYQRIRIAGAPTNFAATVAPLPLLGSAVDEGGARR